MAVVTMKGRVVSTANGYVNAQFDNTQSGAGENELLLRGTIIPFLDPGASVSQGAYSFSTSGGTLSSGYITFTISQ